MNRSQFLERTKRFREDFDAVEVHVCALRWRDGPWVLNALLATPLSGPLPSDSRILVDVPEVYAATHKLTWAEMDALIESFETGKFRLGGQEIQLAEPSREKSSFYHLSGSHQVPRTDDDASSREASFTLSWYGHDYGWQEEDAWSRIAAKVRQALEPWNGIKDVRANFVGLRPQSSDVLYGDSEGDARKQEFILRVPLGIQLKEVHIEDDCAVVDYSMAPGAHEHAVTLVVFAGSGARMRSRARHQIESQQATTTGERQLKVPLPPETSHVEVRAFYRGDEAGIVEAYGRLPKDSSPRVLALQYIYGSLDKFVQDISPPARRGKAFEAGVAQVFASARFSAIHVGDHVSDAVDILAFPERGDWFLAIECTERELDLNSKLTKLATRAKELGDAIHGKAIPVLVTAMPERQWNTSDMERARQEGIIVMGLTHLREVLDQAADGATTFDIRTYLGTLAPRWSVEFPPRRQRGIL